MLFMFMFMVMFMFMLTLCSRRVQVGGLGVNLTGANCVLIFDPDVRA
jgi:hypothetical protein